MGVVNMAKHIKEIHPQHVICFKVGNFYNCYGKDAYIISYLFNYGVSNVENNLVTSGFPKNALSKNMARFEKEKLDYMVIDTRNNYDVDYKIEHKNLNTYEKVFEVAHKYVNIKRRIEKIADTLIKEKNLEKIRKIEKIAYEGRKV